MAGLMLAKCKVDVRVDAAGDLLGVEAVARPPRRPPFVVAHHVVEAAALVYGAARPVYSFAGAKFGCCPAEAEPRAADLGHKIVVSAAYPREQGRLGTRAQPTFSGQVSLLTKAESKSPGSQSAFRSQLLTQMVGAQSVMFIHIRQLSHQLHDEGGAGQG